MAEPTDAELDRIFLALADATRRDILLTLRARPASVSELVTRSTLSQPAISKHLKVLEDAGLIRRERDGRRIYSVIEFAPLLQAAIFVSRFELELGASHDRLDALLRSTRDSTPPFDGRDASRA